MNQDNAPEEIHDVSRSPFSIARHYGGARYMGHAYVYDAGRDVLVRVDVANARRRAAKKEAKPAELGLFGDAS
jgi:hypothetical protein